MAAKNSQQARTLDGDPSHQESPFAPTRSVFPQQFERIASGGLDDDPSDSGNPVKNRVSFKDLKGGR